MVDDLVGNAHGNLARVKEILTAHPELINETATWKETPVDAATQMGDRAIIEYLIEKGAPVDFFTALVLARVDRAREELGTNPELAKARGVHGLPPLYFAAIGGSIPAAAMLLEAGADVNAQTGPATPLHGAVMGGHREMARFLIESGADVTLPDYQGRDARTLAMELGRSEIAELIPAP